jgi:hypothetical protein
VAIGYQDIARDYVPGCGEVLAAKLYRTGPPTIGSACTKTDAGECQCNDGVEVRPLLAEIPASALAEVTTHTSADTRLTVRWHESADGLRNPISVYDTSLRASCGSGFEGTLSGHCVPWDNAPVFFTDAGCSQQAAITSECGGEWGNTARTSSACDSYAPTGARVPFTQLYIGSAEECRPYPQDPDGVVLLAVEPVVPLATVTRAPLRRSGGRVQPMVLRGEGMVFAERTHLYDTELETECRIPPTESGEATCVPVHREWRFWTDPDCSEEIGLYDHRETPLECARLDPCCDAVSALPHFVATEGGDAVREVLRPYTWPVFTQVRNGPGRWDCERYQPEDGTLYELGAARSVDFPRATAVVE